MKQNPPMYLPLSTGYGRLGTRAMGVPFAYAIGRDNEKAMKRIGAFVSKQKALRWRKHMRKNGILS